MSVMEFGPMSGPLLVGTYGEVSLDGVPYVLLVQLGDTFLDTRGQTFTAVPPGSTFPTTCHCCGATRGGGRVLTAHSVADMIAQRWIVPKDEWVAHLSRPTP